VLLGDDGYSEVVLSAVRLAPSLGGMIKGFWSCFLPLKWDIIMRLWVLLLNQRRGGSLRIWNAPLTLMLEAVAQARVKAGLFGGFRTSLGGLGICCGCLGISPPFFFFFFFCVSYVYFLCT